LAAENVKQIYGPEVAQGFRDFAAMGVANTDASATLMKQTGGKLTEVLEVAKTDALGSINTLTDGFGQMLPALRENAAALGDQGEIGRNYANISNGYNAVTKRSGDVVAAAAEEQDKQLKKTDKLTQQTIDAQIALQAMTINLNDLAKDALPLAATAVKYVTEIVFAAEAELPETWQCRQCSHLAALVTDGKHVELEISSTRPGRSHYEMLLERRSTEELEEILKERIAYIKARRALGKVEL
jgi:hypothetical protein